MTTNSWQSELIRFRSLEKADQIIWLSRLLHVISMAARDTYEIGGDGVAKPANLRRFNELLHRVASFQKTIAIPGFQGMPDGDFFDLLEHELSALDISAEQVLKRL